ncbi:MAG: DUF167 domain-containing protein [Opitutales bacterium]
METVLKVKVSPGASRNEIKGWSQDHLRIRVKAPPEKGKANKELRRFLAKVLGIAIGQVAIRSGETSRNKTVLICGVSQDEVSGKLGQPD